MMHGRGHAQKVTNPQRRYLVTQYLPRYAAARDAGSKGATQGVFREAAESVVIKYGAEDPWRNITEVEEQLLEDAVAEGNPPHPLPAEGVPSVIVQDVKKVLWTERMLALDRHETVGAA
ncbi:unnamed protein product [Peniophora sp. CBMAI 1063]|nr:unnamed protein product [Peniophora sp. CBMAI 1063]